MKKLSIIVPVYFNELNLSDTIPQLLSLQDRLVNYYLELIFVDDGSKDGSLRILLESQRRYPEIIKVVKLTRNFGSMAAIQAGFTIATGDCLGIISADLQDPPELFIEMLMHWENGSKAVFAVREDREDSKSQKLFSNLYYTLLRKFAIPDYPEGGFDFLLIDQQVVRDINRIQEKNTNLMTLIFWLGYQGVCIPYVRRSRLKGKSRWTLGKKLKLLIDSFVSFSYYPIQLLSAIGILYSFASFAYGVFVFFTWLIFGVEIKGWVPIMIFLSFTAGLQMGMLGVLGEYLWRTLDESRKRPAFVIDTIFENSPEEVSERVSQHHLINR